MAAISDSGDDSLALIVDNFSLSFLPECSTLSGKANEKGLSYYVEGYIDDITVSREEDQCSRALVVVIRSACSC